MNREDLSTTKLLHLWHAGDEDCLNVVVDRHLPWIRATVRNRLGRDLRRKAETGDIVHDALLRFMQYGPRIQLENEQRFRRLLARIVENVIRDTNDWFCARRRDMVREQELTDRKVLELDAPRAVQPNPASEVVNTELKAYVRLALELLTPDDRQIIVMRKWDNLPFAEISDAIGTTEAAASMRFTRAMRRLTAAVTKLQSGDIDPLLDELESETPEPDNAEERAEP